ncbi:MAG: NUDIX domain-containing protein [Nitrososphaerota archaeon]|nr:NUDIX domain-containing protein [Nitrososphaerota archaeon]
MENVRSAGVILFTTTQNDTSFLLLRHRDGHWGFPKGHMLSGEDEFDCAIRELKEETGVTREQIEFLVGVERTIDYSYERDGEKIHEETTYLLANSMNGPVSVALLAEERNGYLWTDLRKALELLQFENLKWVLTSAYQLIRNERQKSARIVNQETGAA